MDDGQHIVASNGSSESHPEADHDVYDGSDHAFYSMDAFTTPETEAGIEGHVPAVSIEGAWEALLVDDSVAGHVIREDCQYALSSLNLTLRQIDGQILGYGDYSLSSDRCPRGLTARSAYAVATGFLDAPYVKLTIRESREGPALFVFYGTVSPEGILGQVRTTDGQLLLEHVTLTAPTK